MAESRGKDPKRRKPDPSERSASRSRPQDEPPTVEFGDPEALAIKVWIREARGKRIYGRCSIELGDQRFGWVRESVKLKDFAESLDDTLYRVGFCLKDELPDSMKVGQSESVGESEGSERSVAGPGPDDRALVDRVWQLANVDSDEVPVPKQMERFIWLEGLEVFDGFRSAFFLDRDMVEIRWRQLPDPEEHVHRLTRDDYERIVDEFLDWFVEKANYRLREPAWFRRYRSGSSAERTDS